MRLARVLVPLGLAHSTFEQPPARERFPVLAIGHDYDGSLASGGRTRYAEAAAGGLWTTAADLARFVAEIQLGLEGRSAVVASLEQSYESHAAREDDERRKYGT